MTTAELQRVERQRDAYKDCLRRTLNALDRMGRTPAVVKDIEETLKAAR